MGTVTEALEKGRINVDRQKEVAAIIAEVKPRLEALAAAAMEEIRLAEETATKNITEHDRASAELAELEERITSLKDERERLPVEHSRAILDDDVDTELRLKDRAATVRTEIESLEARREALRDELRQLSPRDPGHPTGVTTFQYGKIAGTAFNIRSDFEELHGTLTEALDKLLDPVVAKHDSVKATTWQLDYDRRWAERGTRV